MAKCYVSFLALSIACIIALSSDSNAQSVEKGTIIIEPYYGYSNAGSSFSDWVTKNPETKISGLGPLGGRIEYMIANRVGMGVTFNYYSAKVKWIILDSTGTSIDSTGSMVLTNAMVNVNVHLAASSDVLDLYVGLATGTASRKGVRSSNAADAVDIDIDFDDYKMPFAIRVTFGGRYYLTDHLGFSAELGVGSGPLISGGVSVKF